jgi:hypothetical protein
MATSWIRPLHRTGSNSVSSALERAIGYVQNELKTDGGVLVKSYECEPYMAESEFMLSKANYGQITGRNQGKSDVVAYHIRLSFPPGELSSERVLEIGDELARRWTKGKHQYIVAAHNNTNNPHCHIIYNSTTLDCKRKFKNFKFSSTALRRLSDQVCLENGLSIIEQPGHAKGWNRQEYLGKQKAPTGRDKLREIIDECAVVGRSIEDYFIALKRAGVEVKRGKQFAFKLPDGKKFFREDTLGDDYSVAAIMERLSGKRIVKTSASDSFTQNVPEASAELKNKPNLLIDIQEKMQQGYGEGFAHWARLENIQSMSKTLIFMRDNGLDNYDELVAKQSEVAGRFHSVSGQIKALEERQKQIAELQKQIGNYGKTRDVYAAYKASGFNSDFYEKHRAAITLHKAAKKYFDEHKELQTNGKLPSINMLKEEWAKCDAEKRKAYSAYHKIKDEYKSMTNALSNARDVLGIREPERKSRDAYAR